MTKHALNPGHVPTRKAALAQAKALGCIVTTGHGGEVRVEYPGLGRVNLSNRRKDATRDLLALLRTAEAAQADLQRWKDSPSRTTNALPGLPASLRPSSPAGKVRGKPR